MPLVAAALVVGLVDWWAVAGDRRRVEFVAKPLVMVLLIAAVVVSGEAEAPIVALIAIAFGFSLVGDVALMVPDGSFELGLGAFLAAHCFTVTALLQAGLELGWLVAGIVVVGAAAGNLAVPVVRAAAARARALGWGVSVYIAVLALMSTFAVGVGHWAAAAGGLLFLVSDALLGWGRFVGPTPGGRVAVHATYHFAQSAFATWVITT